MYFDNEGGKCHKNTEKYEIIMWKKKATFDNEGEPHRCSTIDFEEE